MLSVSTSVFIYVWRLPGEMSHLRKSSFLFICITSNHLSNIPVASLIAGVEMYSLPEKIASGEGYTFDMSKRVDNIVLHPKFQNRKDTHPFSRGVAMNLND
jgi:hypothetical protein